jgi:hypothetical protein
MLYHVSRSGQTYGPYTLEDLQRYVASGNILSTDLAKGEELPEWVPVAQVLGMAAPAVAPVAYPATTPVYAPGAVPYPDPPNLHWALVLLFGVFTCGLFFVVWNFVQAAWMRKVNPNSKALFYYIASAVVYVILIGTDIAGIVAGNNGTPSAGVSALSAVAGLAYLILFIVAIFTLRSEIEAHFNGPEPIGLSLSGVMTFFFNVLYFQYHFTRINELKRLARYRGSSI